MLITLSTTLAVAQLTVSVSELESSSTGALNPLCLQSDVVL